LSRLADDIVARIRDEIVLIDKETGEAVHAWKRATLNTEDADYLLKAVALSLHTIYSGLERSFERIARRVDEHLPTGPAWHRDILFQMAAPYGDARPSVVSMEDAERLGAYVGFRHVVRNIHTHTLQPRRIGELVDDLPSVWDSVHEHLETWLDQMTRSVA